MLFMEFIDPICITPKVPSPIFLFFYLPCHSQFMPTCQTLTPLCIFHTYSIMLAVLPVYTPPHISHSCIHTRQIVFLKLPTPQNTGWEKKVQPVTSHTLFNGAHINTPPPCTKCLSSSQNFHIWTKEILSRFPSLLSSSVENSCHSAADSEIYCFFVVTCSPGREE